MAKRGKKASPPETKILSETRQEMTPEEMGAYLAANPTSPNPELDPSPSDPQIPSDPAFTIDEEGNQVPGEPTHDPLKDTKAELTKTQQELAESKKLNQAMASQMEMGQMTSPPVGQQQMTPQMTEMYSPTPLADETQYADPNFPAKFYARQEYIRRQQVEQRTTETAMRTFVRENKDFPEHLNEMRQLKAEDPDAYVGPDGLQRLYDRAKERKEFANMQETVKEAQQKAFQAGADTARQPKGRQFVSPSGGVGGVPSSGVKVPADFGTWPTNKQKEWLERNGFVRPY